VSGVVTVAIPVLNGARYLDEVLRAVRAQHVDREVEILIVDSGSTDGSLEIARRHGAVLHEIPKTEFSHGGTRNRMVAMARGAHVAFLAQDATPAHPGWLAALLEGFEAADDVAAVFGPHVPRPDASHMIKCEMERHFATWGDGGRELDVQRLDRSPAGLAAYRSYPGRWSFLSDVNCAVARWAWERIPYRDVPYAEDQLLGRELVEAGWAKVFHPDAVVIHSHDYPPGQFLRRYFDEFRGMREVLGHREPMGPKRTVWAVRGLAGADKRWLREHGVRGRRLVRPLGVSVRHHAIRMAGAIVGSRADRVPAPVRRRLSLEGRDTFTPVDVPASPLLRSEGARRDGASLTVTPEWGWEWVRRSYPSRPIALEPHPGRSTGPFTIAWVVPPWKIGSGGHTTIFRLVREMERRGHRCALFQFDPLGMARLPAEELRAQVREHFVPVEAQVFVGLEDFHSADFAVATNWWTAYPVRDLRGCREKVYLVQDDEPRFHAASSQSIWAEETYRMGYRCVAYTPWMADILRERYGLEARFFECGTDTDTYSFAGGAGREPGLVAVYARQETERRAVELALAGLATAVERRPGVRAVLFGSNVPISSPVPCESWGVRPPRELAELYRRASAGIVFSLTTHSLVAQEMMASGLPVVELEGDNVSSALGASGDRVMLAEPRPDAIADALLHVLDRPREAAAMARRARAFVESRTWERAGDQLEGALREFMASPRRAPEPTEVVATHASG
jgi:glycosyltransferase involved in cell wall biosynthesis